MQQVGKLGPYRVLRDGWRGGTMRFVRPLNDYRLTTAKILYHLPDHPALLQAYTWQVYTLAPRFPALRRLLPLEPHTLDVPPHTILVALNLNLKPTQPSNAR